MRVIPDNVLETLTCRICCRYLTVTPIGVHPDGGNVCGRCLYGQKTPPSSPPPLFECRGHPGEDGAIPLSLLGYASFPGNLFPCVNRFEGCDQLMPFSGVRSHESQCVRKKNKCPLCQFSGVGSQLVRHFQTVHGRYISSDDPVFALNVDGDRCEIYLYRSQKVLCWVKVRFDKDINQFVVETRCLGAALEKVARILLAFRVPRSCRGGAYEEYDVLSKPVVMSRDASFVMTFSFSDFRLCEAKRVVCIYRIFCVE